MGKVTARTGPSHFKQLINMKKYTLIRAYDLCIVPTVPWLNTIWMRKANFESYIIPSENEWKDRRYGETGLLSWAWEPILNFWPVLFVWNNFIIKLTKQPYTLFPQSHPWIHVFTCLFFPHPQVLATKRGLETSKSNTAQTKVIEMNARYKSHSEDNN